VAIVDRGSRKCALAARLGKPAGPTLPRRFERLARPSGIGRVEPREDVIEALEVGHSGGAPTSKISKIKCLYKGGLAVEKGDLLHTGGPLRAQRRELKIIINFNSVAGTAIVSA
jgi:hypothetical protein